jgi:superfamily II DNA helicase RecQ
MSIGQTRCNPTQHSRVEAMQSRSMTHNAEQFFIVLREYGLIVCKACKYAVWPKEVERHLSGGHHRVQKKQRDQIIAEVGLWQGLVMNGEQLELPDYLPAPVPELALHDGLLCTVEPDICQGVFRSKKRLQIHLQQQHGGWTATGLSHGRPLTKHEKQEADQRFEKAHAKIHCQRFFGSRHGSHFIRIVHPGVEEDTGPKDLWESLQERAHKAYEEKIQQSKEIIEEGEEDDVNPWLSRTKWHKYLKKLKPEDMMAAVAPPSQDPEEPEPYETVIWKAMTDVAQISQMTVSKAGVFVRMEAVRSEKHQTRYTPLETYWDPDEIARRVQPWRQMMVFFVRTQKEHDWKSPPYKFTPEQFEKFDRLIEEAGRVIAGEVGQGDGDAGMTAIQRACLDFCIELLNMEIEFTEYESALVCALAVLGVSEAGWRGPDSYPPILSAVIKCARFMVVQKAVHMAGSPVESEYFAGRRKMNLDEDSGYDTASPSPSPRSRSRRRGCPSSPIGVDPASPSRFQWASSSIHGQSSPGGPSSPVNPSNPERRSSPFVVARIRPQNRRSKKSCLDHVKSMMDEFMVRGSKGPMQWMLDLRTYGLKIHYNTTSRGHVEWCNGDELLYKDAQFNMAQFRGMVHGLMAETRQIMVDELLFCDGAKAGDVPEVPWNTIRDDPTNTTPGWSFLDDARTRLPVDGKSWLFERIGQQADVRRRFERAGTKTGLNSVEVEKYMASIARFREKLLVAAHIVGGQPARGTEMLSIRHSNTWKGGHRNVFIEDGLVVLVTKYHKGYALSGDVKIIHRYLPRELSALVVLYLWLVRPFERRLQAIIGGQYKEGLEEDQNTESKAARLFCRDGNGRDWTSSRMRQALERATRKGLGHALHIPAYRDVAISINRRYTRGKTAFDKDEGSNDGSDGETGEDEIGDLQAGHGSHIAGMVYARGMFEMDGAVASKRQQYRQSSIDWHRLLAIQSAVEIRPGQKRKRDAYEEEASEAQYERWARLQQMNMREQFARMMKLEEKEGQFRGIQEQAIQAIQARVSPVVAVMPTGTGKSVLFMLPAWAESGGTTVVIVPLIALRYDMQRRCRALGISCAEWESNRSPPDAASIVLMTPESALGDDGSTFINRLKQTRRLDRIVIDECHVILNTESRFRPKLRELGELARVETQMILLTATLPPCKEELLWKRMSWTADEAKMFRMPTTRKNIRYGVVKPGTRLKREEHNGFIASMVARMHGKGIVYCKAKTRVKEITKGVLDGCAVAFHGDMDSRERAGVLDAFRTGKTKVVVATNALGMGVDIPDIEWIIHADEPRDMLDYAQESGRAGRDGRISQAILVSGYDASVDTLMQAYVEGEGGCRRKIPSAYLDGEKERGRCRSDEEPCDLCRPEQIIVDHSGEEKGTEEFHTRTKEGSRELAKRRLEEQFAMQERRARAVHMRRTSERMVEAGIEERLERQLWDWKGKCIVCRAAGEWCGHVITNCTHEDGKTAAIEVKERRVRIRFKDCSACGKCGVPQSMCNGYRENGKGGYERIQKPCQWYGIMASTVYGLRHAYRQLWESWMERLIADGVNVESSKAVDDYLGQRRDKGGLQGSNLAFEFLWITDQIGGRGV